MSPGPDVFFITQLESRKSILGKPHSGNIFPRVLERFNWSSEKENNSGVCVCVKWYKKRWSVHVCWMEQNILTYNESVSCSIVSNSLRVYGLQPTRLLCPWDSPGQTTGVDCLLIPGDLPNPGVEPDLLHCRQILYHLSHQGCPIQKRGFSFCLV